MPICPGRRLGRSGRSGNQGTHWFHCVRRSPSPSLQATELELGWRRPVIAEGGAGGHGIVEQTAAAPRKSGAEPLAAGQVLDHKVSARVPRWGPARSLYGTQDPLQGESKGLIRQCCSFPTGCQAAAFIKSCEDRQDDDRSAQPTLPPQEQASSQPLVKRSLHKKTCAFAGLLLCMRIWGMNALVAINRFVPAQARSTARQYAFDAEDAVKQQPPGYGEARSAG